MRYCRGGLVRRGARKNKLQVYMGGGGGWVGMWVERTLAVVSSEQEARRVPEGSQATVFTSSVWPCCVGEVSGWVGGWVGG